METWLDSSRKNTEFLDNRYAVFRKDRCDTKIAQEASIGGGVLLAVKKEIKCEEYVNEKMLDLEAVCVRIPLSNKSYVYIYSLYIQPSAPLERYRTHLEALGVFRRDLDPGDIAIINGDFNLGDTTKWLMNEDGFDFIPVIGESESAKAIIAREVTSTLLDLGFFQMSNLENTSGNVLELVYTNYPELAIVNIADFRMLPAKKSDMHHVPLMCTVECMPVLTPATNMDSVFCFRKADYDQIRNHLNGLNFAEIIGNSSTIDMISNFYGILYDTFEKFVPKASLRISYKPKWHDKQLSHLKNIRNKLYKKLCDDRKTLLTPDEQPFIQARLDYENYRKQRFSDYLREKADDVKSNPKSFWGHINDKRKPNQMPSSVRYEDQVASSDKEMADLFAQYFKTVYKEHDPDDELQEFIDNRQERNCHKITSSTDAVFSVLNSLDTNKGSGFDGVSAIFLRQCADILAEPLNEIFSQSLNECIYPDTFKIGQITPIYKAGKKDDVRNYRGVNIVPMIAKVFDRLVYQQLKVIIQPRISTSQHGFLPSRNIDTNLMGTSTRVHEAIEQGAQLDSFYGDISLAFDHVNRARMIRKLSKFPVSNQLLRWFMSYLSKRKQYVSIRGSKSETFDVPSGVGQGTILGPLLFLIFFNDSDNNLPEGVESSNFADDKKLTMIVKNVDDARKLQIAIDAFIAWCDENGLNANFSKCKIISFTHKKSPIIFEYTVKGKKIDRVSEIRDLGVILDAKLNFNTHIEYVCKKATTALQFTKRQAHYFDKDIVKLLYCSLVRSTLEFACSIWSPYHFNKKNTVESIQKQIVMTLNDDFERRREGIFNLGPYVDRGESVGLTDTLTRRRVNAMALFIHAIITGRYNAPALRSQIELNTGLRTLRNPEFIRFKTYKTDYLAHFPFDNACNVFNHAALYIDPSLPKHIFKEKLLKLPDTAFGQWTKF